MSNAVGACKGLNAKQADYLFFTKGGQSTAIRMCVSCPLQRPCLEAALDAEREGDYMPFGVFGAYTADQRAALLGRERGRWR